MTAPAATGERLGTRALAPGRGDRAIFVGQTGSGKTTLVETLLRPRRFVVVLDAKGLLRWPGYVVCTTLAALTKCRAEKIIYRPTWRELQDPDEMESFFVWVYLARNRVCYVDELASVTQGDRYPPHFGACFTRGRELGISMWTATQRPKRIPQVAISESEHAYVFKLKMPQDRERVAECTGIDPERIAALPKHDFLYARQDSDTIGPLHLTLP